jgi:hypothetical protein
LVEAEVVFGVVECQGGLQGVGRSGESVGHLKEHRLKSGPR